MIDNHKVVTQNLSQINKIWSNTSLLYKSDKDYRVKDEVRNVEVRSYKNLTLSKYFNRLEISGSIHYFFNDGLHNANDFNVDDCISTFKELIEHFDIRPKLFKVIGLEYGYNIQPQDEVNQILSWLRFFGKKQISESLIHQNFYVAGTVYKSVKIYNKTQDCPRYAKSNVLRFEVKTRESQFLRTLGINTLEDLLDKSIYMRLSESILGEWNNILLFDFDVLELSKKHITEYWLDAINNKSRNTFINRKKEYFKNLPKNSLFYKLKGQFKNKADEFLSCAYLTTTQKSAIVHNRTITKPHNAQLGKNVKYCIVTGVELRGKDANSKYIRRTTLRNLRNNDKEKYFEICCLLLNNSDSRGTKFEKDIIAHLDKQVRNRVSGMKKIREFGYNVKIYPNQLSLSI